MLPNIPEKNYILPPTVNELWTALDTGEILQSMCIKCDALHNLHVDLGSMRGFIPNAETGLGFSNQTANEYTVLSRVGKAVSFHVLDISGNTAILSRRSAQLAAKKYYFNNMKAGSVISAVVQNPATFGVFCDIGCGLTGLMRIDRCCISRLETTAQLFQSGQNIYAAILNMDIESGRIELTGRELLGTWEENAALFHCGEIVTGVVRSIMPYGIFIELTPNLSGLAEYQPGLKAGDAVSTYIRSIQPEKHKIKLNIVEHLHQCNRHNSLQYHITSGKLDYWEYFSGSHAVTSF